MTGPDLTPPPDRDLPATEQRRSALVRELRAPRQSRLRRRHALLVPAGLLVTAGAAWAAGVFSTPIKDISTIDCRAGTERGALSVRVPSFVSGNVSESATETCLSVPQLATDLGFMRAGTVRPLVSCRGERQAVVVPGEDAEAACARMGLNPLSSEEFRAEVRRQVRAFLQASALLPDPDDQSTDPEAGEGADCVVAGSLQRRAEKHLREHGFEDFHVRSLSSARRSDCASEMTVPINSDGRTFRIITDGDRDSSAHDRARGVLGEPACRRLRRDGRLVTPSDEGVLAALECVDAQLFEQRGHRLRPAEVAAAVRDRLGMKRWRATVKVPRGAGVIELAGTSLLDRADRTFDVLFALRRPR